MTRTALVFGALAVALASMFITLPAQAQRVFVSGSGSDTNPCTFPAPCRTFQQAFNTVAANGEIDVLDPAGYGGLTITHGITIQGHGFSGITETTNSASAITINSGTTDPITLNGLLIDGVGTGSFGIHIEEAASVQILNCVVRHFTANGINFSASNNNANLLIEDTVSSDNALGIGIDPSGSGALVALRGVTINDNSADGVDVTTGDATIANSVMSNNGGTGINVNGGTATIANSVMSNNFNGLVTTGTVWLAKSVLSKNENNGIAVEGTANSYGDNYINDNGTNVLGGLTTAHAQ